MKKNTRKKELKILKNEVFNELKSNKKNVKNLIANLHDVYNDLIVSDMNYFDSNHDYMSDKDKRKRILASINKLTQIDFYRIHIENNLNNLFHNNLITLKKIKLIFKEIHDNDYHLEDKKTNKGYDEDSLWKKILKAIRIS